MGEVMEAVDMLGLEALAEFAAKPVYRSQSVAKKLYENTVEEARALVTVRDQNKKKVDGQSALGMSLGRNLLPLDKIKAKATRLVVSDDKVEAITAALKAHAMSGVFDEEIAEALAKTKATAEKMAEAANKKDVVDGETEAGDIAGLGDIEDLDAVEDTGVIDEI